ncbi:MAG: biopolymer transporter ExbD, partial [Arenibacterium sp.]
MRCARSLCRNATRKRPMRNVAPRRRRVVSLTALIDVVFLLLLFFMLTSTFSSFGEIELFPPAGVQGVG